jgi:MFS family permease
MNETVSKPTMPRFMFLGIFGGLFCSYLALSSVIPVLPTYVRDTFQADNLAIGLIVTATALTAVITRPIAGTLADRHGYRFIMQIGALLVAGGGFLYLLPVNLISLVLVRLLIGIGEGAVFTAGAAWTVSLAPSNRRGQLIGLYGVSMWGGITLGTLIGAALLQFGYTSVWLFAALVPLVGLALISSMPAPQLPATPARHGILLRPALLPGLSLALAAAGYAGLAAFIVLYLRSRGIENGVIALTAYSASYAGTRLFIGHLPDQLGPRKVAAWAGVGEAIGLLIIALAPTLWVAVIGGLVMGTGFSLLYPSLALIVMNLTEKQQQGAALGAYTSFWDLGLGIWGPAMGAIATAMGYSAVFFVGAGCALAAVALALAIRLQPATMEAEAAPQ